jgi:bacillithiol biosynthesis deacetylase BshB1
VKVDVLAVGAHPDDVELGIGGLLHKLSHHGYLVGILDLTQGELGTRGTVEEREAEAANAARILGAAWRENASLPDGQLANTPLYRHQVIPFIRLAKPRLLLAPMSEDRHPDHSAAHEIVRDANFYAGLTRINTSQEPYRVPLVYYYRVHGVSGTPLVVVDISAHFEAKLEAIRAYGSQFYNPAYSGEPTYISTAEFWEFIKIKAAYWGHSVGVACGEPLYGDGPVGVAFPPGLGEQP